MHVVAASAPLLQNGLMEDLHFGRNDTGMAFTAKFLLFIPQIFSLAAAVRIVTGNACSTGDSGMDIEFRAILLVAASTAIPFGQSKFFASSRMRHARLCLMACVAFSVLRMYSSFSA